MYSQMLSSGFAMTASRAIITCTSDAYVMRYFIILVESYTWHQSRSIIAVVAMACRHDEIKCSQLSYSQLRLVAKLIELSLSRHKACISGRTGSLARPCAVETLNCARWEQLLRRREDEELVYGARSDDLNEDMELHKV